MINRFFSVPNGPQEADAMPRQKTSSLPSMGASRWSPRSDTSCGPAICMQELSEADLSTDELQKKLKRKPFNPLDARSAMHAAESTSDCEAVLEAKSASPVVQQSPVDEAPIPYWRAAWATCTSYWPLMLGNILEWYEFSTYGYLVPEIRTNFFRGSSFWPWIGFGLTFAMRPLGGVFLGWISDRFGRRIGTTVSLAGMIVATVLQGCLPSAVLNTGTILPLLGLGLLLSCRMLQGLFAGGEICGISVTLGEHPHKECLGFASSLIMTGAAFSFFLSSGLVWILHLLLTKDEMMLWGWRIPFILPVVPGVLALVLRMKMPETTAFLELQHTHTGSLRHFCGSMRTVFCGYWGATLVCIGGTACKAVSTYMGPVYTCDFVTKYLGVPATTALGLGCVTQLVTVVLSPLMGCVCDWIGIGRVMLIGSAYVTMTGISVYAFLIEAQEDRTLLVVAGAIVFGIAEAITSSAIFLWSAELYETALRTAGMGLSFNFGMALFGGFAPVVADMIASKGFRYAPGIMITCAGMISLITVAISRWCHHHQKINLAHIRPHPY